MIVNIDGRFVPAESARVPIDDGGFLYGDTLFETMLVRNGAPCFVEEHLARLERSARLCDFPCPLDEIETAVKESCARLEESVGRLRLTLSRGSCDGPARPPAARVRFVITLRADVPDLARERMEGVRCVAAPNRRVNPLAPLPQMKRGNYQDCLYALHHARTRAAFEAIFIGADGELLEGATSNLFVVRDDTLLTPPASELVLPGVMRKQVLRIAGQLGLPYREEPLRVDDLANAREVFLTNSLIEVLPVGRWEDRPLNRGPLHARFRDAIVEISAVRT